MNTIVVSEPVFKSSITFYVGAEYCSYRKSIDKISKNEKIEWDDDLNTTEGMCLTFNVSSHVWINPSVVKDGTSEIVLDHEIGHAIFSILRYLQINITDIEKEEVFLYMKEFYFEEIKKKLRKKKK